ncbi:MAG: hypothetical protein NT022_11265, partial [Deltaproteobacteria bacterium]|nr:hypothetical protein [Deltaproteobacteria bacterium]
YKSFYERTGYAWRNDRQRHRGFERWARNLFSFKKVLVLGAYHQEMLCAVAITYWVANLILFATYFSDTKSLKLGVSDFMWHHVREMASQCNGVTHIYSGVFVGPKSTDEFKLRRGAKIITIPAYYRINAISLSLIKLCEKEKYEQLIGYDEGEVDIMLELLLHRDKQQRFV